ncbi:MAG: helix-turn-helix domain-containing protein [Spirochaetaceae bacterium]|jgi:transcriptional regulator with XRE-family HTH domain|nr:helix-turn-helix domain-containing protein [Spirochaetaceae bacterium]
MNHTVEDILDKIRTIRLEKGISIVKLANSAGISHSHLYYIETKKIIPSIETLSKIAEGLGVTMKDFFD